MCQELNSYEKLKVWQKEPTHVDIIEAEEVSIQLYIERYKGKLVLHL